ncbi:helix-turn-helix domain-containing protein [Streptomyces durbertensis]|uniref:helix-turn-helix domain-containing protein n=1 Tax=Streptomyces durbertensis TaxID=2448886 RepID=UPI002B20D920|nr:helix-turn-helix domain-containing protein [Streptomyces durbertensis]
MSLTAIGVAVHIQSLPDGARVDIRSLAARFPEGEIRIASALRELEAHGYLTRTRHRAPSGRIVTRTVYHHRPGTQGRPGGEEQEPVPRRGGGDEVGREGHGAAAAAPAAAAEAGPTAGAVEPPPVRGVEPVGAAQPVRPQPLPQPKPREADDGRLRLAASALRGLRGDAPALLLTEADVRRLAPAAAAWLERGTPPEVLRHALTTDLPQPLRRPAALVAHRLAALLPAATAAPPRPSASRPVPLQNCDGCDRAYRATRPGGRCGDCRRRTTEPPGTASTADGGG